jgi:hypothetical protein
MTGIISVQIQLAVGMHLCFMELFFKGQQAFYILFCLATRATKGMCSVKMSVAQLIKILSDTPMTITYSLCVPK